MNFTGISIGIAQKVVRCYRRTHIFKRKKKNEFCHHSHDAVDCAKINLEFPTSLLGTRRKFRCFFDTLELCDSENENWKFRYFARFIRAWFRGVKIFSAGFIELERILGLTSCYLKRYSEDN